MTFGNRLKQAREEKGYNQKQFAGKLGISATRLNYWEKDKREPDVALIKEIASVLNISSDWLIGNELKSSEIVLSEFEKTTIKKYRTLDGYGKKAVDDLLENEYLRCAEVISEPKVIKLPMAELKASAGTGQWLGDDEYTTWVDVVDTPEARKANVVIEVSGDSMLPDYHDGDKVLVKLNAEPNENEIGIFIIENNGYIKKLGKDKLISLNKEYPDIPFADNVEVNFVGKVIGIAEII